MSGARDYLEAAEAEIAHWPGVAFRHEHPRGKGHPRIVVAFGSRERFVTFPGTPSDSLRGVRNHIADLRKALREMGAERREVETVAATVRPPKRRPPKRRFALPLIQDSRTGGFEALRAWSPREPVEIELAPAPIANAPTFGDKLRALFEALRGRAA